VFRVQVQYRFPEKLAVFPSDEFYQGRLRTGITDAPARLAVMKNSKFPWPTEQGVVVPIVFVQCTAEEDMGGMSKSNAGQAEVVQKAIKLLTTKDAPEETPKSDPKGKGKAVDRGPDPQNGGGAASSKRDKDEKPKITVLTPYTKQVSELKSRVPNDVGVFTIDSFQGRESDIIIFSIVRCNVERDIGFVEDERRLNVMWTRAKLALIIVGDRPTLAEKSGLWKRALDSYVPVAFPEEDAGPQTQ
jgi:superfamily I DNA and/or RNA helicase